MIRTERLVLRRPVPEDFGACFTMRQDAQVVRFLGGKPDTAEECWARLLRINGQWDWLGFGTWTVCDHAGGFLGLVGFLSLRRGIAPDFDAAPELGWVLAPLAQGRGIATEAVRAALAWSDATWPGAATVCMVDPDNAASLNVAAKCGLVAYGSGTYKDHAVTLLSRRPPA